MPCWSSRTVLRHLIDGAWWLVDAFLGVVEAIADGFDIDLFAQAGKAMLQSFIDGFLSMHGPIGRRHVSGVLSDEVRDWLPFSDAKKGPLSDLTASGARHSPLRFWKASERLAGCQ